MSYIMHQDSDFIHSGINWRVGYGRWAAVILLDYWSLLLLELTGVRQRFLASADCSVALE